MKKATVDCQILLLSYQMINISLLIVIGVTMLVFKFRNKIH